MSQTTASICDAATAAIDPAKAKFILRGDVRCGHCVGCTILALKVHVLVLDDRLRRTEAGSPSPRPKAYVSTTAEAAAVEDVLRCAREHRDQRARGLGASPGMSEALFEAVRKLDQIRGTASPVAPPPPDAVSALFAPPPAQAREGLDLMPIGTLSFSVRTENALTFARPPIVTIGALRTMSSIELLKVPKFGQKSLREVRIALADRGISLRGEDPGGAEADEHRAFLKLQAAMAEYAAARDNLEHIRKIAP